MDNDQVGNKCSMGLKLSTYTVMFKRFHTVCACFCSNYFCRKESSAL